MFYLILGLFLLAAFLMLIKGLSAPNPETIKKISVYCGIFFGVIILFLLLRAGLPIIAGVIAAIFALIPYLGKILNFLNTAKTLRKFFSEESLFKFTDKQAERFKKKHPPMTKEEAMEILGIQENASKEEIKAAYHNLMKKNHPDAGGSKYIASKLNQAKDILL